MRGGRLESEDQLGYSNNTGLRCVKYLEYLINNGSRKRKTIITNKDWVNSKIWFIGGIFPP